MRLLNLLGHEKQNISVSTSIFSEELEKLKIDDDLTLMKITLNLIQNRSSKQILLRIINLNSKFHMNPNDPIEMV